MLARLIAWIGEQWRLIDEDSRPADGARVRKIDWRPPVVLCTIAVTLTLQYYYGDRDTFAKIWPRPGNRAWLDGHYELVSFVWWAGWRFVGFFVVPALVVLAMPGERLRDYGFSTQGFSRHVWIYVGLFGAVLPVVVIAARFTEFRETYPFYKLANRTAFDLLAWEGMYALQFFALEFCFRGFMLHGLKRSMGVHAIWVMIVPYTMIHFDKPIAETLGAVGAGLILGTLAMRTRSIWCGVLIHISVAVTMDVLALSQCPADRPCPAQGSNVWEMLHYEHR